MSPSNRTLTDFSDRRSILVRFMSPPSLRHANSCLPCYMMLRQRGCLEVRGTASRTGLAATPRRAPPHAEAVTTQRGLRTLHAGDAGGQFRRQQPVVRRRDRQACGWPACQSTVGDRRREASRHQCRSSASIRTRCGGSPPPSTWCARCWGTCGCTSRQLSQKAWRGRGNSAVQTKLRNTSFWASQKLHLLGRFPVES